MVSTPTNVRNYFKLDLVLARSCIILRQVFKSRYYLFTGGQVWSDSAKCGGSYFVNIIGKNKKFNLTTVQKTLVCNGDTNEWDLTTLMTLLMNTDRPKTLDTTQIQQLDNEDQLLFQLREIRNTLAHHPSKNIGNTEFYQFWSKLVAILVAFGDAPEELDKLKRTQAHREQKFSDAITLFTKSATITDVSNHDRAIVYSNLSASRLALYEQQFDSSNVFNNEDPTDQRYHALRDAKQARMLSPTSWQGHFRVGKAYSALSEHERAINSFERALALDPNNKKIQEALDDSRQVQCRQSRNEHLDPKCQPITIPEHLNEMKQKFGTDPQQIRAVHKLLEKVDSSMANVIKGHKYEHGDIDIKQDYEQAAKYFAKAANQGNAEGLFNLARLTDRGLGVKKDPHFATKLLEQAAAQSPQHPKCNLPNIGIAESEHSLGLRYAEGVFVPKNFSLAAQWYQRAVDHGNAESANNLAIMYLNGSGVEKNLQKAKELFELSARRGDPKAMMNLAEHLLEVNDLEMAKIWFNRACEAGNLYAQTQRNDFELVLNQKQQLFGNYQFHASNKMQEVRSFPDRTTPINLANNLNNDSNVYDLNTLNEYAQRGSLTAEKMCNALRHFHVALHILTQSESLTKEQETIFIHEFARCCRIEHTVAKIPNTKMEENIKNIIDRVFQRCCCDSDPMNLQLDEDVRVCYVVLHIDSPKLNRQFLDSCKEKYPKSVFFLEFSAAMNVRLGQFEATLKDIYVGLEIDSNYYELLFINAILFIVTGKEINEIIKAFQHFLAVAPSDHCKVLESYYLMASSYLASGTNDDSISLVKKLYQQGQEAEKLQLPYFLPYKSLSKMTVKSAFNDKYLSNTTPFSTASHRSRLTNPHRIDIFARHREWSAFMSRNNNTSMVHTMTQKTPVKQSKAKSLIGLKSISLREINPTKDHVYHGYVLFVTIIDEALSWRPSIHLVIEDENHDCDHMIVYDFNETQGEYLINEVFKIGTRMHIINPYLRIGANDGKPFIRVDDFSSIIFKNESERVAFPS
ncbi:unnamed protein product [Rotaria sp. Silwood2]|nr:unnamed protein product [Rotaria sp. Silwood2]